jgi:hypothetical protein
MMDTDSTVKPTDLRHDERAARILDLILEDGKTTLTVLKEVGVPRSTRYFWLSSGKIDHVVARAYGCASPVSAAGSPSSNCSTSVSLGQIGRRKRAGLRSGAGRSSIAYAKQPFKC